MQFIALIRINSNLGKGGGVWYFLCPKTANQCRTLYWGDTGFVSRQALGGALYQSQQVSKTDQASHRFWKRMKQLEGLGYGWLLAKGSKREYGGELTRPMRRYLRYEKAVEQDQQMQ